MENCFTIEIFEIQCRFYFSKESRIQIIGEADLDLAYLANLAGLPFLKLLYQYMEKI